MAQSLRSQIESKKRVYDRLSELIQKKIQERDQVKKELEELENRYALSQFRSFMKTAAEADLDMASITDSEKNYLVECLKKFRTDAQAKQVDGSHMQVSIPEEKKPSDAEKKEQMNANDSQKQEEVKKEPPPMQENPSAASNPVQAPMQQNPVPQEHQQEEEENPYA